MVVGSSVQRKHGHPRKREIEPQALLAEIICGIAFLSIESIVKGLLRLQRGKHWKDYPELRKFCIFLSSQDGRSFANE